MMQTQNLRVRVLFLCSHVAMCVLSVCHKDEYRMEIGFVPAEELWERIV